MLWGFAKAGHKPKQLVPAVSPVMQSRADYFQLGPDELVMLLSSFTPLAMHPGRCSHHAHGCTVAHTEHHGRGSYEMCVLRHCAD